MNTKIGILTLHLHLPGCSSLKEKRSIIKSLIAKIQNKFKLSVAEIGHLEVWQDSQIAIVSVSNDRNQAMAILQNVLNWVSDNWHDGYIANDDIEVIY